MSTMLYRQTRLGVYLMGEIAALLARIRRQIRARVGAIGGAVQTGQHRREKNESNEACQCCDDPKNPLQ